LQWGTVRKLRATFSNQIRAAAVSNSMMLILSDNKGTGYELLTVDPCGSFGLTALWLAAKIAWVRTVARIEPSAVLSWSSYFKVALTEALGPRSGKSVRGGSWPVPIFVSALFSCFEARRV
jgi:hypothetical protein